MPREGDLHYIEFPVAALGPAKAFYEAAFGWSFTDWGPAYASFSAGVEGGFQADPAERLDQVLPVIRTDDLEAAQVRVTQAGGIVSRPVFSFPGGRRFHFLDPSGNTLAVAAYET